MPKNIVIFSDGTGQEGGIEASTNIYKLFNMIVDRMLKQMSFYDRNLGAGNLGGLNYYPSLLHRT